MSLKEKPLSLTILAGSDEYKNLIKAFVNREETISGFICKYEVFFKNNLFWATFYFSDNNYPALLADEYGVSVLISAMSYLHELSSKLNSDAVMKEAQVQIMGDKLVGLIDLLLSYAAVYEGLDLESLSNMIKTEQLKVSYNAGTTSRH